MIITGTLAAAWTVLSNPAVTDTILVGIFANAFFSAWPKPGSFNKITWQLSYKFLYDWLIGFITLKQGHPVEPIVVDNMIVRGNSQITSTFQAAPVNSTSEVDDTSISTTAPTK